MSSTYPTTLDAFTTSYADDGTITIHAAMVTDLADGVNKIEAELGTLPKGGSATVKARIAATEAVANAAVPNSLVTTAGDIIYATGNAALARLAIGASGKVLSGGASAPSWLNPPGYEYSYVEVTTNQTTTVTSAATAVAAVTSGAVAYDGSTKICIEFFCPEVFHSVANTAVIYELYDGSTDLGIMARAYSPLTNQGPSARLTRVLTPSAATHTYSVRVWGGGAGTCNSNAGTGGASTDLAMFIRITKA